MENDEQLVIENPEYRRHVRTGADADAYDQRNYYLSYVSAVLVARVR